MEPLRPARRMRPRWRLAALCAALSLFAVAAMPLIASAHALLISSSPRPGERLGTAPGVVVLEFSETLNSRLASALVTDPTGHRWSGGVSAGAEIRVPLATNAPGVYAVDWTSVSGVDGHYVSGSFSFDVGAAGPGAAMTGSLPGPQASDIAIGAAKWVEALALLFLAGQVLVRRLGRRRPALAWVTPRFQVASLALSAGLVEVWAEATVASGGHSISAYLAFFGSAVSGPARVLRLGFEALALVSVIRGWRTLPLWVGGALVAVAASGHAAGIQPAWLGIGLDGVHLLAAGVWAGGIAALALLRPPDGWRSAPARALLARFTPIALIAFAVTVTAGALEAAEQLGSLQALVATSYGEVLLAKMALVALMLPLSVMAWRLSRPHLRLEAGVAGAVVAAAALLAAFPAPPTQAARQAATAATATPRAGLPTPGELTLAGRAGSVLVGLSIDPGTPGPNRVTVYLLPVEGTAAAAALPANIIVAGATRPLVACGDTCRRATVDLRGGDLLLVDVLGPDGGEATFTIPQLPAPPGTALLAQLQAAMHQLSAYEVTEVLSSGPTTIRSSYASTAPDRTTWTVNGSSETVWIGTTQYSRDGPGLQWRVQRGLPANTVPSFVWDFFRPLTNASIIGDGTVGGVPVTIVSCFGDRDATAIWFTFWIDAQGRAREVSMSAPGHFMTDTYLSYNAATAITAPVASAAP